MYFCNEGTQNRQNMRLLKPLFLCFPWFHGFISFGQTNNSVTTVNYLTPADTLSLIIEGNSKFVCHPIKPKQTLYGLSRFYQVSVNDIYACNPEFSANPILRTGATLRIPLRDTDFILYRKNEDAQQISTPVYYEVQAGDNLFRLCRAFCNIREDSIKSRNNLSDTGIRINQLLLMGWFPTRGVASGNTISETPTELSARQLPTESQEPVLSEKAGTVWVNGQGACNWISKREDAGKPFALHRTAKIGTMIEVTNTLLNRTITAEVIGRIPPVYENNIEVVLSHAAAQQIGARDKRFFVYTKYQKQPQPE
jgi:LysM repeat protein